MRRTRRTLAALSLLAVMLTGVFFATRGGTTTAQELATGDAAAIVGTWSCQVTRSDGATFQSVLSYNADGNVVAIGSPAQPTPPNAPPGILFTSTGLGSWKATGPDTVVMSFIHIQANGEGQFTGTITPRTTITLGADGQSYLGEAETTIAAPDGRVVATLSSTSACTRLIAEAPAVATPEA